MAVVPPQGPGALDMKTVSHGTAGGIPEACSSEDGGSGLAAIKHLLCAKLSLHCFPEALQPSHETGTITLCILQMRKQRLGEFRKLVQGHGVGI